MYHILINSVPYPTLLVIRPDFCIINFDEVYVFAKLDSQTKTWDTYNGEVSDSDKLALNKVIQNNGGFDNTTISIEKK